MAADVGGNRAEVRGPPRIRVRVPNPPHSGTPWAVPDDARLQREASLDILGSTVDRQSSERNRRAAMAWETPMAIEWRFGFEITSYVANR
jgi:coenzyme PQQ precursor peptide PqqA